MRNLYLFAIVLLLSTSCKNLRSVDNTTHEDYLIFGHFYGRCIGENCIETFKLDRHSLYKDILDSNDGDDFKFVLLEENQFEKVKDLFSQFPDQLIQEKEEVIGCPDCADGGGIFIKILRNRNSYQWRIDKNKDNLPSYLHFFIDQVNTKIDLLSTKNHNSP